MTDNLSVNLLKQDALTITKVNESCKSSGACTILSHIIQLKNIFYLHCCILGQAFEEPA